MCIRFLCTFFVILCLSSGQRDFYIPPDLPQDTMVDIINNFGLELLKKHNEYNENNIALSPYGAASVLVALNEGTRDTAQSEIQRVLRLPYDASIVRIGLRDVLRRLKSYFIPEEGFLAGLTFSNDNITLREDYKNLLMFYGYDVESFNSPLYTSTTQKTSTTSTTVAPETSTAPRTTGTPELAVTPQAESTMLVESRTLPDTTAITESTNPRAPVPTTNIDTMITEAVSTTTSSTTTTYTPTASTEFTSAESITTALNEATSSTNSEATTTTTYPSTTITTVESTNLPTKLIEAVSVMSSEIATTSFSTTSMHPEIISIISTDATVITEAVSFISSEVGTTTNFPATISTVESTTIPSSVSTSNIPSETTIFDAAEDLIRTSNNSNNKKTTGIPLSTLNEKTLSISDGLGVINEESTTTETSTIAASTAGQLEVGNTENSTSITTKASEQSISTDTITESNTNAMSKYDFTTNTIGNTGISTSITTKASDQSISTDTIAKSNTNAMSEYDFTTSTISLGSTLIPEMELSAMITEQETTTNTSEANTTEGLSDSAFTESVATTIQTSTYENTEDGSSSNATPNANTEKQQEVATTRTTNETKNKRSTRERIGLGKHYLPADYYLYNHDSSHKASYEDGPSLLTFLVNGKTRKSNISFMTYKAVLPFCYIPALKSLALSFPLDSTRYYLLLILPIDDCGADFVLERMGYDITLKDIISSLTFTYVKATIPSFTLRGTVVLTSTLQEMGIRSVFEPRTADFSKMTDSTDIYVTNIEQLITVTIRNYIDPNRLEDHGNHHHYHPVWFKADHPFLYFVMDSNLHVTLMAGKVINPLNSRIS